ncbi:MAG TPA: GNAT family N-acetyltransferase [Pyrinomonadaceae bacterium]|nr:GNAT family N-acetyltransferase [Pyrinomonadaceae bacterium]
MRGTGEIEIRLLSERDLGEAMRLKKLARWNQTLWDWRRLVRLEPAGCFCANLGRRLVGTTTTTTYGDELAWVGMVLVDPEYRRRGVATRLMETALSYLEGRVAAVKLDATPEGRPVYERFGFQVESLVERWAGAVDGAAWDNRCGTFEPLPHDELLALDREAFGADRSRLIESLMAGICIPPSASVTDGRLSGYAFARQGSDAFYVGPLVTADARQAATLLDGQLSQLAGSRIYVDLNTNFERGAQILAARGFTKQRDLFRMSRGATNGAASSAAVFAIAGPEVG